MRWVVLFNAREAFPPNDLEKLTIQPFGWHDFWYSKTPEIIKIAPKAAGPAVDTTGAGDLWASGFLFGFVYYYPYVGIGRDTMVFYFSEKSFTLVMISILPPRCSMFHNYLIPFYLSFIVRINLS